MPPTHLDDVRPSPASDGRCFLRGASRPAHQRHPRGAVAAALLLLSLGAFPHRLAAQPASRPAVHEPRRFQPGVQIDWAQRAVRVDGHVVLRQGLIEFLACFVGKEHESVIRLDASATHVYMALGLVGLQPGHPPYWQEQRGRFGPPAGDLIDVTIEWQEGMRRRSATGFQWIREIEFARTPIDRPWVFAGSRPLRDGTLSADQTGDGIAVVDKPDCLLALSRNHVSRDPELWAQANTPAIPPLHTPVRVVLRPARAQTHDVCLGFRGELYVDGHFAHPADAADLIKLARILSPDYVQSIHVDRALRSDVRRARQALTAAGVADNAMLFVLPDSLPTNHEPAKP